jgi:hypothetical protein
MERGTDEIRTAGIDMVEGGGLVHGYKPYFSVCVVYIFFFLQYWGLNSGPHIF